MHTMRAFIKELFQHFGNCNSTQKGSSLAYYAVFSIIPILILIISVMGFFWGEQAVKNEIFDQIKGYIGSDSAIQIQNILKNQHINHKSILTTAIGVFTLVLGASGMLTQIHSSFNDIWGISTKGKNGIVLYILTHLKSLIILIVLFFIMFASTSLNSFLVRFSDEIHINLRLAWVYEHLISFSLLCVSFGLMFSYLGDAKVNWRPAFIGGVITAILFVIGKIGIGMYIGHSHVSTTFGAASSVALILVWVYYISQIIFLGASFVYVIGEKMGYKIAGKEGIDSRNS